ncbi:MAG: hypothetical protein GF401_04700 [Chitinivibrionales bacterium]|nr:hypothetical protein [Chitinivibrionales bacterium]
MNNLRNTLLSRIPYFRRYDYRLFIIGLCLVFPLLGAPPPDLPGEDITDEYSRQIIPEDSVEAKKPTITPESPNWLEKVSKTWDAPSLAKQLAADHNPTPLGKGAVYIPYMTKPSLEPEIEIINDKGKVMVSGKPGNKYNLMPGTYYVIFGSGPHKTRMVRSVTIIESKVVPLIPDWSGLVIDVVDRNNTPIPGEYEIARIDHFETYGRGYGREPDLGEELKTWILKPGIYKIYGIGDSYNTLTNFVTVRLLPGELINFILVQNNPEEMVIEGGGIVYAEASKKLTNNWKYGFDVGGSVDFNAENDKENDTSVTSTSIALLLNARLNYKKNPIDWISNINLNEGIDFSKLMLSRLDSKTDELRLFSIFVWRFLPWLGPYGRMETNTEIFPSYARAPETAGKHYFLKLNSDSTLKEIDSLPPNSSLLQPAFSPFKLEIGAGANFNIFNTRYFDLTILSGFGFSQEWRWNESVIADTIIVDSTDQLLYSRYRDITDNDKSSNIVRRVHYPSSPDYGPEAALNSTLRLGRLATIKTELEVLFPIRTGEEMSFKPQLDFRNTLSWRLFRAISLVYDYRYQLQQPVDPQARINESRHQILIQYSYSSR